MFCHIQSETKPPSAGAVSPVTLFCRPCFEVGYREEQGVVVCWLLKYICDG